MTTLRTRRQSRQERRQYARQLARKQAHYADSGAVYPNLGDMPMEMLVHIFEYVAACADLAAWCNQHVTVKLIARVVLLGDGRINSALCMVYRIDGISGLMQKLRVAGADKDIRWCSNIGMNLFKKITITYGDNPAEEVYDQEMIAIHRKLRMPYRNEDWKQIMDGT